MKEKDTPDGGQVATSYNDTPPVSATATTKITSSLSWVSTTIQDGLGRARKTQLTSDPDGTTYTRVAYDALGRKSQEWNPTRCDPDVNTSSCAGEPTFGYKTYSYDAVSRPTSVLEQDQQGTINTSYSGNCTTVTDEAGKARQSCSNGLGQMTTVLEDPGIAPHLNYETDYQYDVLGNLTRVDQKGGDPNSADWRTRTFTYDSLSRLKIAANPESGTINYVYDLDSTCSGQNSFPTLLVSKTDARGVRTCMRYDALNRLTQKNYSTSDPTVNYYYDQTSYNGLTIGNGIGKRTGMSDASGATAWSYDITTQGWKTTERRTISGVTNPNNSVTQANLDGSVASIKYPSGRTITYTVLGAGRPTAAQDTTNGINYVTAATYAPQGALSTFTNGGAIGGAMTYNSRLQPLQLYFTAGTITSDTLTRLQSGPCPTTVASIMSRSYNFSLGANDNGNVLSIINCRDTNRSQNFSYDALNRIQTAYTAGPNWGESYGSTVAPGGVPATPGIDAWGNLWQRSPITGKNTYEQLNCPANIKNQLTTCSINYDAAGNMISNGGASYTYDAENRLATAGGVTSVYDGDGNRVMKCTAGAIPGTCATNPTGTLYWGAGPQAESDLAASSTSWKEYVFFGGKRVARRDASNSSVHYFFADHLGSSSVSTNSAGTTLEEDLDYYPYGGLASGTSSDHYLFTGKERDTETGLDYFGARYYGSNMGRWLSPDWAATATAVPYADFGNPQSLNLYGYVGNNPLSRADADGHCCTAGELADYLDSKIEVFRQDGLSANDHASPTVAAINTFANGVTGDLAQGFTNLLRTGQSVGSLPSGASGAQIASAVAEEGGRVGGTILVVVAVAGPKAPATAEQGASVRAQTPGARVTLEDGSAVDLTGKAHRGVPTPHIKSLEFNTDPATGVTYPKFGPVRPATIGDVNAAAKAAGVTPPVRIPPPLPLPRPPVLPPHKDK